MICIFSDEFEIGDVMLIKMVDLIKKYGEMFVIKLIDFELDEGDFFGFIGFNGVGKIMMMRIILMLFDFFWGEVYVCGYLIYN